MDTALDTENMEQVYQQYRKRYGIPSAKEIMATRKRYGLSATRISEILGLGTNQYRLYESGEMLYMRIHSVYTFRMLKNK